MGDNTSLKADAIEQGKGGKVIVWADGDTVATGTITARGGAQGGDGGFIETSGKATVDFSGARIDASAKHGKAGLWLIDPMDLDIDSGGAATIAGTLNGGTDITVTEESGFGFGSDGAGNITVSSGISWGTTNKLTLDASNGIDIRAGITGTAGGLNLQAGSGGITQNASGKIKVATLGISSFGDVTLNAVANEVGALSADLSEISGKNLSFKNDGSFVIEPAGGVTGIRTNNGTIDLSTVSGNIHIGQNIIDTGGERGAQAACRWHRHDHAGRDERRH